MAKRLLYALAGFGVVEHHLSGACPPQGVYLPENSCSGPVLCRTYTVPAHQLIGFIETEIPDKVLHKVVLLVLLKAGVDNIRVDAEEVFLSMVNSRWTMVFWG